VHWVDYYLKQNQAYYLANGVRLVDYLDLHDYPQGGINNDGVAFGDDAQPGLPELRLRSIKSLYDSTYVDESWIGGAGWEGGIIRMIPRMKDWVANNAPGMKTAITEYNWGSDDTPTGALAQAEVLAIFGREGLDLATRWAGPP
jgi:Glycoside hydrolase family 44